MWPGRLPEGVPHEAPDRDTTFVKRAGLEAEAVRSGDVELEGVRDHHDPLLLGEEFDERIEEGGLPGSRPAGDEDVPPLDERLPRCLEQRGMRAMVFM